MSLPTLTDMLTRIRDRVQDSDSTMADSELTREINVTLDQWMARLDDRPRELTATQTGLTTSTGVRRYTVTNTVPVRKPLGLFTASSAGSTTPITQLEWLEPHELQAEWEALQTNGTPIYWTAWRVGTATAADVGKWVVGLHPPPSGVFYYILRALVEPTALSAGTDVPDVTPVEAWGICDVVASRLAVRMGREPEFVDAIVADIPEGMRTAFDLHRVSAGPRERPEEKPS